MPRGAAPDDVPHGPCASPPIRWALAQPLPSRRARTARRDRGRREQRVADDRRRLAESHALLPPGQLVRMMWCADGVCTPRFRYSRTQEPGARKEPTAPPPPPPQRFPPPRPHHHHTITRAGHERALYQYRQGSGWEGAHDPARGVAFGPHPRHALPPTHRISRIPP